MAHPLLEELNEFKRQFKEKAQAAIKSEFRAFFDKHPEVGSVVWTQYTPYFNDGDECVFGVNDFEFRPPLEGGSVDDEYEYADGGLVASLQRKKRGEWTRDPVTGMGSYANGQELTVEEQSLVDDAKALAGLCHGLKETMKDVFDDHCKVVATRDGFDVVEYEHD